MTATFMPREAPLPSSNLPLKWVSIHYTFVGILQKRENSATEGNPQQEA